jgi:hypothetical protein
LAALLGCGGCFKDGFEALLNMFSGVEASGSEEVSKCLGKFWALRSHSDSGEQEVINRLVRQARSAVEGAQRANTHVIVLVSAGQVNQGALGSR